MNQINQVKSNHRGGKRVGAGRKKSALTIRTRAMAEQIIASGIAPLEHLITLMREAKPLRGRNESDANYALRVQSWKDQGFEAAKAAAPYIHPRLAALEHSGSGGDPIEHSITVEFVAPK